MHDSALWDLTPLFEPKNPNSVFYVCANFVLNSLDRENPYIIELPSHVAFKQNQYQSSEFKLDSIR